MIGNKFDLYEDEEVSEKEAREWAETIGALFFLTSARTNVNIDTLFEEVSTTYLKLNGVYVEQRTTVTLMSQEDTGDPKRETKCCASSS